MKKVMMLLIVGILFLFTTASGDYLKGYLDEMGDSDYFEIYTGEDELEVTFGYPDDTEFCVLILGEAGKKLGYFDLTDGEIISLTGGGTFIIVIISHEGDGKWTAWW